MDLVALRKSVEAEIDSYVYELPDGSVGTPLPNDWIEAQLCEMRNALVEPAWETIGIGDSVDQIIGKEPINQRQCVLIADDKKGYQLYFDPKEKNFVLAYSTDGLPTSFLRGDAVGCFIAR
jgi:hypothetical protein